MVDQFSHQSVPAAIDHPAPGAILHSFQGEVEGKIIREFLQQINTETRAALE